MAYYTASLLQRRRDAGWTQCNISPQKTKKNLYYEIYIMRYEAICHAGLRALCTGRQRKRKTNTGRAGMKQVIFLKQQV